MLPTHPKRLLNVGNLVKFYFIRWGLFIFESSHLLLLLSKLIHIDVQCEIKHMSIGLFVYGCLSSSPTHLRTSCLSKTSYPDDVCHLRINRHHSVRIFLIRI